MSIFDAHFLCLRAYRPFSSLPTEKWICHLATVFCRILWSKMDSLETLTIHFVPIWLTMFHWSNNLSCLLEWMAYDWVRYLPFLFFYFVTNGCTPTCWPEEWVTAQTTKVPQMMWAPGIQLHQHSQSLQQQSNQTKIWHVYTWQEKWIKIR